MGLCARTSLHLRGKCSSFPQRPIGYTFPSALISQTYIAAIGEVFVKRQYLLAKRSCCWCCVAVPVQHKKRAKPKG